MITETRALIEYAKSTGQDPKEILHQWFNHHRPAPMIRIVIEREIMGE